MGDRTNFEKRGGGGGGGLYKKGRLGTFCQLFISIM